MKAKLETLIDQLDKAMDAIEDCAGIDDAALEIELAKLFDKLSDSWIYLRRYTDAA